MFYKYLIDAFGFENVETKYLEDEPDDIWCNLKKIKKNLIISKKNSIFVKKGKYENTYI